ncbi:MAG: extracellular solute-binding protein [Gaiellaceae bacterium]
MGRVDASDRRSVERSGALPDSLGSSWCGQAFADGKVAIAFEGHWLRPVLDTVAAPLEYSIHPLLTGKRRGNLAFTTSYSIAAASQHKQAAWELLSYLTGRDGMQRWIAGDVALPSRDDVTPAAGSQIFLDEAPFSTAWVFPAGFGNVPTFANDELASVFAGGETIDGMLAAVQSAADAALGG